MLYFLRRQPKASSLKSLWAAGSRRSLSSTGTSHNNHTVSPLGSNVGVSTSNQEDPNQPMYVFQPLSMRAQVSPMRVATTWIDAVKARERRTSDWISQNETELESGKLTMDDMPVKSFSNSAVGTVDVVDRSPEDSFSYVVLPFKSSKWLLDAYVNAPGRLRIGQIFQDLDGLAGVIAYRHCYPAMPVIITASVDRIYMKKRLQDIGNLNVTLSGNVTWSGRSSMEITIKAATHSDKDDMTVDSVITADDIKEENVFLTANFTFVARNPETERSLAINKLVPETKSQKVDFVRAEKYNAHKREQAKTNDLNSTPPSEQESRILHTMWLQQSPDPETTNATAATHVVTHMQDTRVSSTAIMQPQYRNHHSYMIFGGYLLRQTFELAYSCAATYSQTIPRFVSLDSTTFRNPVPVGSVLNLTATVVYTEFINRQLTEPGSTDTDTDTETAHHTITSKPGTLIQVLVESTIQDLSVPGSPKTIKTGQFAYSYFVAAVPKAAPPGAQPKFFSVLPQTYAEMMDYLQGRRRSIETANFNTYVRLLPNPKEIVTE